MSEKTFTFKSGVTVHLQFVKYTFLSSVRAAAQRKAAAEYGEPIVPTYTVNAAGGSEYINEHTEESVAREPYAADEELQAEWLKYTTTTRAVDIAVHDRTCRAYVDRGVAEGPSDEWLADQAFWDIELPDDPRDLKWAWIFDVSTGWDEVVALVIAIQQTNTLEEVAAAVEEGFRDSVGASDEGDGPEGDSEEVAGNSPIEGDSELVPSD